MSEKERERERKKREGRNKRRQEVEEGVSLRFIGMSIDGDGDKVKGERSFWLKEERKEEETSLQDLLSHLSLLTHSTHQHAHTLVKRISASNIHWF